MVLVKKKQQKKHKMERKHVRTQRRKFGFNDSACSNLQNQKRDKKKNISVTFTKACDACFKNDRFLYKKKKKHYKIAEKTYGYKHKMKIRNAFNYSRGEDLKKSKKKCFFKKMCMFFIQFSSSCKQNLVFFLFVCCVLS